MPAWAPLLLSAVLMAGCFLQLPEQARPRSLVVYYTLTNEGQSKVASPGGHCGTARIEENRLVVRSVNWEEVKGADVLLLVVPKLNGSWATLGSGSFAMAVPAAIDPHIEGDGQRLGTVAWVGNASHGEVRVDKRAVRPPYEWTVHGSGWRAEARLELGPKDVKVDTSEFNCM